MDNFRRVLSDKEEEYTLDPVTGIGIVEGYEAIDLGLPSGLLWAIKNIDLEPSSAYGGKFFAWGSSQAESQYYDEENGVQAITHNGLAYQGTANTLPSEYDTATQLMGGKWRMPTLAEFAELSRAGICRFPTYAWQGATYTINGKNLRFPFKGYDGAASGILGGGEIGDYWTSTRYSDGGVFYFRFNKNSTDRNHIDDFYLGYISDRCCVRGVHPPSNN